MSGASRRKADRQAFTGQHIVLHLRRGLVELAGVASHDVRLHLTAEAEAELALGVLRELQAISALIIGLRGKASAMPVEKCSDGAASDAAAMFIHGT